MFSKRVALWSHSALSPRTRCPATLFFAPGMSGVSITLFGPSPASRQPYTFSRRLTE
jgi:hypothetical protein